MIDNPFKLTNFEPIVLHYDHAKFWSISLKMDGSTMSRCGPLLEDDVEDESKSKIVEKPHALIEEAVNYVEFHVNCKLRKGYEFLEKKPEPHLDDLISKISMNNDSFEKRITQESSNSFEEAPMKKRRITYKQSSSLSDSTLSSVYPADSPIYSRDEFLSQIDSEQDELSRTTAETKILNDLGNLNNFKGCYLNRKRNGITEFFKVQVLGKYLKIEEGIERDSEITPSYQTFVDRRSAEREALEQIIDRIRDNNYQYAHEKFVFRFEKSEIRNHIRPKKTTTAKSSSTKKLKLEYNSSISPSGKPVKREEMDEERQEENNSDDQNTPEKSGSNKKCRLATPLPWRREDVTGWYMTERLCGIRCYWDGTSFYSNYDQQYNPPTEFIENFPTVPLEGLLFAGRGKMMDCHNAVAKRGQRTHKWRGLKFVVYDLLDNELKFEQRLNKLKEIFSSNASSFIELADYQKVSNKAGVDKFLEDLKKDQGEGILFKDPSACYTQKSKGYLELKVEIEDEGVVIGHNFDSNNLQFKSLSIKSLTNNNEFKMYHGITDDLKRNPPREGTIIVYRYTGEKAAGKPKAPVFVKVKEINE